jgi:hypothetical protein
MARARANEPKRRRALEASAGGTALFASGRRLPRESRRRSASTSSLVHLPWRIPAARQAAPKLPNARTARLRTPALTIIVVSRWSGVASPRSSATIASRLDGERRSMPAARHADANDPKYFCAARWTRRPARAAVGRPVLASSEIALRTSSREGPRFPRGTPAWRRAAAREPNSFLAALSSEGFIRRPGCALSGSRRPWMTRSLVQLGCLAEGFEAGSTEPKWWMHATYSLGASRMRISFETSPCRRRWMSRALSVSARRRLRRPIPAAARAALHDPKWRAAAYRSRDDRAGVPVSRAVRRISASTASELIALDLIRRGHSGTPAARVASSIDPKCMRNGIEYFRSGG